MFSAFSSSRGKKSTVKLRNALTRIPVSDPPSLILKAPFPENEWQDNMYRAVFCPCPHGDTPSTRRFFNAVLAGCGLSS
jgi:hypothetical protein